MYNIIMIFQMVLLLKHNIDNCMILMQTFMLILYTGLIPESTTELKSAIVTPSGVKLSHQGVSGDSGYFSRTDSYSQSDYCDDTESDSEAEKASENGRLQMHPPDHHEADQDL